MKLCKITTQQHILKLVKGCGCDNNETIVDVIIMRLSSTVIGN